MDQGTIIDDKETVRIELVKSTSEKHIDLLRPSARNSAASKDRFLLTFGQAADNSGRERGKYTPLLRDTEGSQAGFYDKPLPCFGCGIGWFSFLLGFLFPLLWFYAAILYVGNHYRKDPRERAGLAAAAVAAATFSVILLIVIACYLLHWYKTQPGSFH